MKKLLSVIISLAAVFCFMLPAFSASAATNCFSISISGTQKDSVAKTELDRINTEREDNGMTPLVLDSELQEFAQKRAAEAILGGDIKHTADTYDEHCADGTSLSFIFPDYGKGVFTFCVKDYTDFCDALSELISFDYENIKSIGIACFKFKNTESYYSICSKKDSSSPFTDFTDKNVTKTINVHYKYISPVNYKGTLVNKRYYKLSITGRFNGFYKNYLPIPNSQLTYKSTNSKVYKVKGENGYVKGTGKYTLELYDRYGVKLCEYPDQHAKINLTAPQTEILSKKKKQLYVRWQIFNDCTGYQVQYSLKKNMKGAKTITVKGAKKSSRTIKKLKSKKKYYVRVRSYINQGNGEKVFTKWSKIKAVKVK